MKRRLVSYLAMMLVLAPLTAHAAQADTMLPAQFGVRADAARATLNTNPAQVLIEARQLAAEGERLPDERQRLLALATSDALRGEALTRLDRPQEAIAIITGAMRTTAKLAPRSKLHGDLIIAKGLASARLGDVSSALGSFQRAYEVYLAADERRGQAMALLDIGSIYRDAGDYASTLKYDANSLEAYAKDPSLVLSLHNNNGNALAKLGRFNEAVGAYRRALAVARSMSSPLLQARILENLASAQVLAGQFGAADESIARLVELERTDPAAERRPMLYAVAAQLALHRGQIDRAAQLIDRTFAGVNLRTTTMPMLDYHRTAYEIFRARGDAPKALAHLEAYKRLDDQGRQLAASTNAALMGARFDFANQNVKIAQRDKTISQSEAAQARLRTAVLAALLAAAGVISTLLLIGFVSIRRSRNQVREANLTLSGTNVALEKALAAKTEFLATTSHEIRTPLNGILGMTQVILADRALDAPMRGKIELVHGAGETMRALVDDILDVAKMETGELAIVPAEMDLARLLGDAGRVWAGQAETKRIALTIDLAEAPSRIIADEVRLRQIVFNLMSNAIKFTDAGEVRLTARAIASEDGERLAIRVADSGIGIPADQLERIFESFRQVDGGTTRRHGGTGLGLTICRNLARAMGGEIRVESQLGVGSVFTIDLPLTRAAAAAATVGGAARRATSLAEATLLIVEANPLSQGILRAVLGGAVSGLQIVGGLDDALAALAAGGVDHVLGDGATLGLDPACAMRLAHAARAVEARISLLWPAAAIAALAEMHADSDVRIIAKPVSAPELLAALEKAYGSPVDSRDIAA